MNDNPVPVGSIWLEKQTGRHVRVTYSNPHNHPGWTYINAHTGKAVPHGYEPANGYTYNDWFEHRCDIYDFLVWKRFERVS